MHNFTISVVDTDSISFCKPDGGEFSQEEIDSLIAELNDVSPEFMDWANDGYFQKCVALKAKNYILWDGKKKILKGSSIRDNKKEPALREFINECIECFLFDKQHLIMDLYKKYSYEACNIKDINRWTVKKTITKPVLTNDRTNERKIREAVEDQVVAEGDKVWLYTAIDGEIQEVKKGELVFYANGKPKMIPNRILKTPNQWLDDQDVKHYIERVNDVLAIFGNLINLEDFPRYHLKRNKVLLEELVNGSHSPSLIREISNQGRD